MTDTSEKIDYSKTLNLPQTEFPMRAGLPKKEPEIVARWQEMDLYRLLREDAKGREGTLGRRRSVAPACVYCQCPCTLLMTCMIMV